MSPSNVDLAPFGDWMIPLSENPQGIQDSDNGNKCTTIAPIVLPNGNNQCDQTQDNIVMDETSNSGFSAEPKSRSQGGLVKRKAASSWGGFTAPSTLDTESVNSLYCFSPTDAIRFPSLRGATDSMNPTFARNDQNKGKERIIEDRDFFGTKYDSNSTLLPNFGAAIQINACQNKGEEKIRKDGDFVATAPVSGTCSIPSFDAVDKVSVGQNQDKEHSSSFVATFASGIDGVSVESDNTLLHHNVQPQSLHSQSNYKLPDPKTNLPEPVVGNKQTNTISPGQNNHSTVNVSNNCFSPLDETNEDDVVLQKGGGSGGDGEPGNGNNLLDDDGYNWRKYGQKRVKGSKHPRSYYKCTHADCPVTKKVERSYEGYVVEIIYKGIQKHPAARPDRSRSSSQFNDLTQTDLTWSNMQENDSFSIDEDDDGLSHVDGPDSKRMKVENYTAAEITGATRSVRETRVIVQTTSDVDILDDGYRWRKYGQKTVKGNPNPRSYYKCTTPDCNVRKHVERASHENSALLTIYEGKHNHEVPAGRNGTAQNPNSNQKVTNVSSHQTRNRAEFEQAPWADLTSLPPMGLSHPLYGLGMNHVACLTGLGLGQSQGCSQMLPVNSNNNNIINHCLYLGHQPRTMSSNMGMTMMPKPESIIEPPMVNGALMTSFHQPPSNSSRLPLKK